MRMACYIILGIFAVYSGYYGTKWAYDQLNTDKTNIRLIEVLPNHCYKGYTKTYRKEFPMNVGLYYNGDIIYAGDTLILIIEKPNTSNPCEGK